MPTRNKKKGTTTTPAQLDFKRLSGTDKRFYGVITVIAGISCIWVFSYFVLNQQPTDWLPKISLFGPSVPSNRKFLATGGSAAAAPSPEAKQLVRQKFLDYHFGSKSQEGPSEVTACYLETNYAGFSTRGYDKVCQYRMTAFYPLTEDFTKTADSAIAAYTVHKAGSPMSGDFLTSTLTPPCEGVNGESSDGKTHVEFSYCPKSTKASQIVNYLNLDDGERQFVGDKPLDIFEIRGSSGDVHLDANLQINYKILSKSLYDSEKALSEADSSSQYGFVMVGMAYDYYSTASQNSFH